MVHPSWGLARVDYAAEKHAWDYAIVHLQLGCMNVECECLEQYEEDQYIPDVLRFRPFWFWSFDAGL
jgi:hypothetical protein